MAFIRRMVVGLVGGDPDERGSLFAGEMKVFVLSKLGNGIRVRTRWRPTTNQTRHQKDIMCEIEAGEPSLPTVFPVYGGQIALATFNQVPWGEITMLNSHRPRTRGQRVKEAQHVIRSRTVGLHPRVQLEGIPINP